MLGSVLEIVISLIFSFSGGYLAKAIDLRNEFGDYYYFLRLSRKVILYKAIYGFLAIAFLLLLTYTDFVSEAYVPDLPFLNKEGASSANDPADTGHSWLFVLISSFLIGMSSKAILDLPLRPSKKANEAVTTIGDVIHFIIPEPSRTFKNIIAKKQMLYLQQFVKAANTLSVPSLAKRVYDFLASHPDYQGEDGKRKIDLVMQELGQCENPEYALKYLYRELGRDKFKAIMGK